MGVNVDKVIFTIFLLGGILAGIAGVLFGMKYTVYPQIGAITMTEILRQYFINHPQSIDKYTFLQNSAFTHWVKEKCSKMC
jgi:ABC-type lipoprotein release transport system permease subunit